MMSERMILLKGVPIKFRGKDKNGYLFGSHHILKDGSHVIIDEGSWYYGRVYPDTVAQLVGYDKDGNEVYEGDILINQKGIKETAAIWTFDFSKTRLK